MKKVNLEIRMAALAVLFILIAGMYGCTSDGGASTVEDFTDTIYQPEYASGFTILGAPGRESTLVKISNPWQGADSVTTQLFIRRGNETVPENFEGQVVNGDAHRVVAMSSTQVAMLDAIDASDVVVGVSGLDYISNARIQERRDSMGDVGFEGNINYELLLSLDPDLVMLYGVNGASPMEGKLKELGIPFVYIGDYLEESPLGKAEWLVAIAEMVGRLDEGVSAFRDIPVRYNTLKNKVAESAVTKPAVMFNTPYGDSWFMPAAENYVVQLVRDAGGVYIYDGNHGNTSVPIDLEEAYRLTSEADVWLNVGLASSLEDVKTMCPKFTDTKCLQSGKVYNNNARLSPTGGNDYYESGVVHPDVILRDLVKILHPELIQEDMIYYRQLK